MQTITPVDVHIENDWRDGRPHNSYVKKTMNSSNRNGRTNPRIRTCVATKTKTTRPKSATLPQQTVQAKPVPPARSRSPSPNRDPWLVKLTEYFRFLHRILRFQGSTTWSIDQRTKICLAGR